MARRVTMDMALDALGVSLKDGVPGDTAITNGLLLESLIQQKILMASNDIGINWDTYEAWVIPGTVPTRIVPVEKGEIIVVKLTNYDLENAGMVYYGLTPRGQRPEFSGLRYDVTIPPGGLFLDFDEGGPPLAAAIAAGLYTADTLTAAIAAAMGLVGAQVYTVDYTANKDFRISAPGIFALLVASGPNVGGADLFPVIGFTGADRGGANTYTGDTQKYNAYAPDENWEDKSFPLFAGQSATLVLDDDLYAIPDLGHTLQVPVAVRRSRIYSLRRG